MRVGTSGEEVVLIWEFIFLQVKVESGRKSIFAQKIAAKRAAEEAVTAPPAVETRHTHGRLAVPGAMCSPGSAEEEPLHSTKDGES